MVIEESVTGVCLCLPNLLIRSQTSIPVHIGDKQYTGYTLYTLLTPLFPPKFRSSRWIDHIAVAF